MKKYLLLIALFFAGLICSAVNCHDYFTWILEVFPGIIGFFVLLFTFKRFRFTYLTYVFILLHCYVLFIGGHYTYALVPPFEWLKEALHQSRNNYDKLGHFFQGFVPAMIARELLTRLSVLKKTSWLPFLTITIVAMISMFYEFLEWFVSVTSGSSGDSFLGAQGDIWDTQWDMLFAIIGAVTMNLIMARILDKQIAKMTANK